MEDFNSLQQPQMEAEEPFFTARASDQSVLDRIFAIFTSPKEALQGIELVQGAGAWLWPLLLAVLITSASAGIRYFTTSAAQDEHTARVIQYEKMANNKKFADETRKGFHKKALEDTGDAQKSALTSVGTVFAMMIILAMISSLFFFILAKFIFRSGDITFSTVLIASSLTMVISAVGDLIGVILQSVFDNGMLSVSPAAFLHGMSPSDPNFVLAFQFNLFKIWDLAIFAIAFASLARRSAGTGIAVVFGSWLLRVAIYTGLMYLVQSLTA